MTTPQIVEAARLMQCLIIDQSKVEPSQCDCADCQKMCKHTPCVGTPLDMHAIKRVHPEYEDKLAITLNLAALNLGLPPIAMIAPVFDEKGCAFFENGKCILHKEGLKPLEGKLANCKPDANFFKSTRLIFQTWLPFQSELLDRFNN
jgi:hypothetical protein